MARSLLFILAAALALPGSASAATPKDFGKNLAGHRKRQGQRHIGGEALS